MGYVYVLEFPDCVKIGYSAHIEKRIKQVERMVGHKAINAYYTEAARDTENAMHRVFESHRVERECFREFFSVSFNEAKETLLDMIHQNISRLLPRPLGLGSRADNHYVSAVFRKFSLTKQCTCGILFAIRKELQFFSVTNSAGINCAVILCLFRPLQGAF